MNFASLWNDLATRFATFVNKQGFTDVVLGISGGIDSAVVTALAVDALGKEHVHGIMLPSAYTSQLSKELAEKLATNLNIDFHTVAIGPLYDKYMDTFKTSFDQVASLTSQNIQARIRGNILMAYSNQYNWLSLCCGNKSEIMMGYCTLYGDTVGAIAPIGNVYKTDVYKLAEYRNSVSNDIPLGIITRAPSAELYEGQQDTDSLPPYDLLDEILRHLYDLNEPQPNVEALFPSTTVDKVIKRRQAVSYKQKYLPPVL